MKYTDLLEAINKKVEHYQSQYSLEVDKAFLLWYSIEGLDLDQEAAIEAVSVGGPNDKSIDLFYIDDDRERIYIAQGKYNKNGKYKAKEGELLQLIHVTDWLSDPEALRRDGKADLASLADDYKEAVNNRGYSVEYSYIFMGAPHKESKDAARNFNSAKTGDYPPSSCTVIDIDILDHIHKEHIDISTRIEKERIEFVANNHYEHEGGFGKAFIATIAGSEFKRLYESYGDALFDRNPRLFLGVRKGTVNSGISNTLKSESERPNFWAYNNGVTFICDKYSSDPKSATITLSNFSIVNGCQTTVSIATMAETSLEDVYILARFIQAEERIINSIIEYNNSQNPIKIWDMSSQDPVQKRLKRELSNNDPSFYYITRRGETRPRSKPERAKYTRDGKFQSIDHALCGQYIASFKGLPAIAYKNKGKIFNQYKETVFPHDIRVEEVVLVWQCGKIAEELIRSEMADAAKRGDEGRLRILKRGSKMFLVATMALILERRNGKHYLGKLSYEKASSKKTRARLKGYAVVALEWYIELLSELVDTGGDLATLIKSQEDFYPKLKGRIESKWKIQKLSKTWLNEALEEL